MRRGENLLIHGLTGTPEHRAWCGMMARCYSASPGDHNYEFYRGAGVVVADQWHEFLGFLADMGPKPSPLHSLDRFPDAGGNYEPGNCRWATAREQARNWRSRNRRIQFDGRNLLLSEWAAQIGISRESLRDRIACGWSIERALTTPPVRSRIRNHEGRFTNA